MRGFYKMRIIIYPYKMASRSSSVLAQELRNVTGSKVLRVFPDRKYRRRRFDFVINWGSGRAPKWDSTGILNVIEATRIAQNKRRFLSFMNNMDVSSPKLYDTLQEAPMMLRYLTNGHGGKGCHYADTKEEAEAIQAEYGTPKLIVEYIKKKYEYRIHIFNGNIFDVQQKMKKREVDNDCVDYQIRNHANGWIFGRENVAVPDVVCKVAKDSYEAMYNVGLSFGAFDIAYNVLQDQAYVLEVNTAPGLEGSTVEKYANQIRKLL